MADSKMDTASASAPRSTGDLLQQFVSELEEWDAEIAAGLAAVNTLQSCLKELHSSKPPKEATEVHKRLLKLAPSFRLEQYIQQQQKPAAEASDAASSIHTAINSLKAAVEEQQQLLESLSATFTQYQEAVLSQQLADTALVPPTAAAVEPTVTLSVESPEQDPWAQALAATPAAAAAARALTAEQATVATAALEPVESDAPRAAVKQQLQPEEVALLMDAVTTGLQRDLQWMEAAVGSISLDTTTEELNTLSTFWELQPFTNEAAVSSLVAAAAAAEVTGGSG